MNSYTVAGKKKMPLVTNSCGELKTENLKIHLGTPKGLMDFRDRETQGGFILLKSSMKEVFIETVRWRMQRTSLSVIEGKGGVLRYDI